MVAALVYVPKPVAVTSSPGGRPQAVEDAAEEAIREEWLVEDRRWTSEPIRRRYFELVLAGGRCIVVFSERGNWIDPNAGDVLLSASVEVWLADRPQLRPRTRELYRSLLRLHVLPTLGAVELAAITPATVRSWRAGLISAGRPGASTIAKARAVAETG